MPYDRGTLQGGSVDTTSSRWVNLLHTKQATNKLLRERRATAEAAPVREIVPEDPLDDLEDARERLDTARRAAG